MTAVRRFAAAALLVALPCPALAVDQITLDIGDLAGPGWAADGLAVSHRLDPGVAPALVATARRVLLPPPVGPLTRVRLSCGRIRYSGADVSCPDGTLRAVSATLGNIEAPATLRWLGAERAFAFDIGALGNLGGRLSAEGRLDRTGWQLVLTATGLDLTAVTPVLAPLIELPGGLAPAGLADGIVEVRAIKDQPPVMEAELTLRNVDSAGFDDRLATGGLNASLRIRATPGADSTAFHVSGRATGGELYAEPVYLSLAQSPVEFSMDGVWHSGEGRLDATVFSLDRPGALTVHGGFSMVTEPEAAVTTADIEITRAVLPGGYAEFVRPWLIGTPLDSLTTSGRLNGNVSVRDGAPVSMDLDFDSVSLDDDRGRFSLAGVDADLHWRASGAPPSRFDWLGGSLYGIAVGAAGADATVAGSGFVLNAPVRLPVLDGHLAVRELAVQDTGNDRRRVRFDAELEPVGLTALTGAIGWPTFGGTLSGRLPSLTYENEIVTLGGSLQARVFDGDVAVDDLRIEDPLGVLPVLTAKVTMRQLDLAPLTRAFEFGRMEGRMNGDIVGLRLLGWKPVQFDARFYTPPGDRSRHRISQRAIESISNIGGFGAAGALSGMAMALFKDFGYERIDISCRLRDEVCQMGGIAGAADDGYYLVKGRGLPRIDVIGYANAVNWPTLVDRLSNRGGAGPKQPAP